MLLWEVGGKAREGLGTIYWFECLRCKVKLWGLWPLQLAETSDLPLIAILSQSWRAIVSGRNGGGSVPAGSQQGLPHDVVSMAVLADPVCVHLCVW